MTRNSTTTAILSYMFIRIDGYAEAQIVKMYTSPLSQRPPVQEWSGKFSICLSVADYGHSSLINIFRLILFRPRERDWLALVMTTIYIEARSLIISIKHTRDARLSPKPTKKK